MMKMPINNQGSASVAGLFVLMVITLLGLSILGTSMTSLSLSRRDLVRVRALSSAEGGVDKAIAFLMSGGPGGEDSGDWRTTHPSSSPTNHAADTYYSEDLGSGDSVKICVQNGQGITAGKIVITSIGTATYGSVSISRTIKAVVNLDKENVSAWNNVIFGGVGQAGKSIQGNVDIRGSVHLLGDGETYTILTDNGIWDNDSYTDHNHNGTWDPGETLTVDSDGDGLWDPPEPYLDVNGNGTRDPALTVTDLASDFSGAANIGNNYSGMPTALRDRIMTPTPVTWKGESVESLDAKLRVKNGRVNVSGSANIGSADAASNTTKETMTGTYVSDGFGGTAGASSVHADNGTSNGYDLGDDLVKMPTITFEAYTKDGVTYANYLAYLKATSTVVSGNLTLAVGSTYSVTGAHGSLSIGATGTMNITGKVFIEGDLTLGPKNTQFNYTGSGTLVSSKNIYVHASILPTGTFPTSALGLVAAKTLELGNGSGDSQLTMALAMYAENKVISSKQNQIAGSLVSSYFEMTNVPSIYQVPALATNLPPGMPGSDPIWMVSVSVESWQEI